ncbi:MAG: ATP-dependent Clp protease ATP-binding subunit ClpX [Lachnospiraceae bacterium]|nr:ATP-dependent Clp protease ATP-binding subunit ClpX [Lachnospiraceae bacterium]
MSENNENNKNEYEEVCMMCHRPESKAGKMFHLPGGICVCDDCMHQTMDMISKMDPGTMTDIPGFPGAIGGMKIRFDMPVTPQGAPVPKDNPAEGAIEDGSAKDTTTTDTPDETEKKDENVTGFDGNVLRGFPNISFLNMSDLQGMMPGRRAPKKKKSEKPVINIKDIPAPHIIKEKLDEYVVGQEHAKKVMSVAVYNHYKRVASGTMDEIEIEKSNMLMIGPTGCGKTYMVKTLAKLLDVPLAIADATSLTEAGYIGDDIESVISKLLAAADNDVERAEQGIVFIDEIDKIARKKETHSRDVSGESVQQGMLKLLEGAEIEVPVGASSKNAMVPLATVNTKNILFICGGAFPDLEEIIKERLHKQTGIGFGAILKDDFDKEKTILQKVTTEDIRKFGMIPEFIGRLPIVFTLEGLGKEMMVKILKEPKNAILKQYQKLLELDEVKLVFDDSALEAIADKALERDTGARALRSIIEEFMLDIMYEIPKDKNIGTVTITREYIEGTGGPVIEIREALPPGLSDTAQE